MPAPMDPILTMAPPTGTSPKSCGALQRRLASHGDPGVSRLRVQAADLAAQEAGHDEDHRDRGEEAPEQLAVHEVVVEGMLEDGEQVVRQQEGQAAAAQAHEGV